MGTECGQVLERQRAASGLHIRRNAARQVALIEIARTPGRQMRDRRLEFFQRQERAGPDAPWRRRRQAVPEIDRSTVRITPQVGGRARDELRGPPVDRETVASQRHARAEQFVPRQFGVAAMRLLHAGDHAGHRDRTGTVEVAIVLDPRPREQIGCCALAGQRIILNAQAVGCTHAVIDHLVVVVVRPIEHHRTTAAEAAVPRLQHAERERRCDDGIDAIAAGRQHLGANRRRPARLRGDDAALGNGGRLADLLGTGKRVMAHGFGSAASGRMAAPNRAASSLIKVADRDLRSRV